MQAFRKETLMGDVFGGLTAAIVALPLALAFGVQSGLGAIYGLYGAMFLGMIAACLGGTNTQVSGPTGPMTVITALVVATAIETAGSQELGMSIIVGSFMMAGVFLVLLGFMGIGKSIRYMPYPVVSGFMSGIGIIIILYQLYPLMGHFSPKGTVEIFKSLNEPLSNINWHSLAVGLSTIAIIYLFPRITKKIPSLLVALIVMTVLSAVMELHVSIIGDIPKGFPELKVMALSKLSQKHLWIVLEFGATLAALCAIDSLLTSVIADNITKTKHNSNRELIGQGIGNLFSGMFAGLPGAGATLRTVVNINSGGRTKFSGFLHGLVLFVILMGAGKYVSYVPLPVLAGILITVGFGIIDYRGFKHLNKVPRADAFILLSVVLITVFGNLLHAVGVGLVLACVLFMKKAADIAEENIKIHSISAEYLDVPSQEAFLDKIIIKDIKGPLFFGFSNRFLEMIDEIKDKAAILILNLKGVPNIDQSGLYALEETILQLEQKGVLVFISGIKSQPLSMLERIDMVPALIPREHVFENLDLCSEWLKENIKSENDLMEFQQQQLKIKQNKESYRL